MTFHLIGERSSNNARSPFRIAQQETGREVTWINRFLVRAAASCGGRSAGFSSRLQSRA